MILPVVLGGIAAIALLAKAAKGGAPDAGHGSAETVIPTKKGEVWHIVGRTNMPADKREMMLLHLLTTGDIANAYTLLDGPTWDGSRFELTIKVEQPIPLTLGRQEVGSHYIALTQAHKMR